MQLKEEVHRLYGRERVEVRRAQLFAYLVRADVGKGDLVVTVRAVRGANAAVPPLSSSLRYPFAFVIIASGSPASFATSMP